MKSRSTAARLILDRELNRALPRLPRGDVLDVGSKDAPGVIPLGGRLVSAWMLFPRRGLVLRWVTGLVDPLFARRGSKNTKAACGYLVLARR